MPDPNDLRIRIAEAKGCEVVGMAYCWAPDGPPWSVLEEGQPDRDGYDYSPVWARDGTSPLDGRDPGLLGQACGYDVEDLERVPDYPGDPREWAGLLEELAITLGSVHPLRDRGVWNTATSQGNHEAPTLGEAVCLAWIAWNAAKGSEVRDGE